jgi:hemerythrin
MGFFDWIFKKDKNELHLEWDKKYQTGIIEIDAQHKKLFGLYNSLVSAIYEGQSDIHLQNSLKELIDYAMMHFRIEESYMQKYEYPEFEEHKQEHRKLREQTYFLAKDFEQGKPVLTMDLLDFLKKWLSNHVMVSDMKYKKYLWKKLPKGYLSNKS